MNKDQSETEESFDAEIECSDQENVYEYSPESMNRKEINKKDKKLKIDELKRPPLYPISDLNAVSSNDSIDKNSRKAKVHIKERPSLEDSRQTRNDFKDTYDKKQSIIWIILGIIFSLICYFFYSRSGTALKQFDVSSILTSLKNEFGSQPEMTFRIINSSLTRVSSDDPEAPAILLLIESHKTKNIRDSFSRHLARSVSQEYVLIQNNPSKTPEEMKMEFDYSIKKTLTDDKVNAVLVRNLDQIPFEAAMIFHGYCDHENAQFKKAVYVMTMTSDEAIEPTFGPREWDDLAHKRLKTVWKNSNEDQVASLISRLTVRVCAITSST